MIEILDLLDIIFYNYMLWPVGLVWAVITLLMWVDRKLYNERYIKGFRGAIDRWCDRMEKRLDEKGGDK